MASNALRQLITDAWWGELDYFIIDMPPGTSDIHLTLVQTLPITGVIVVTTPQEVALADARKGVAMFREEKINVPVLGIVENMAWFTPEAHPEEKYFIFGKEGGKELAKKLGVRLLAQIPLVAGICEDADKGSPSSIHLSSEHNKEKGNSLLSAFSMKKKEEEVCHKDAETFSKLATAIVEECERRNSTLPPTQKVNVK